MALFSFRGWHLSFAPELQRAAASRVQLAEFQATERKCEVERTINFERAPSLTCPPAIPLDADAPTRGCFALDGMSVRYSVSDQWGAEATLKLGFQLVALQEGGLLVHGAAVAFGDRGVLILGESGAGKSTLARLCVEAGGDLLSDETVAVIGSRLYGTPFSSEPDLHGRRAEVALNAILVLEKASHESFTPVPDHTAARLILAQPYRSAPGVVSPRDLLDRVAALARVPGVTRFGFRKDPGAATALVRWIAAR